MLAAQFDATAFASEEVDIEVFVESEDDGGVENNEAVEEYADGDKDEADGDLADDEDKDDAAEVNDGDGETDGAEDGDGSKAGGGADSAIGASGDVDKSDGAGADESGESKHGGWEAMAAEETSESGSESGVESSESSSGTNIVVSRNADVVFVIDATGSMSNYIKNVKDKLIEFVQLIDQAGVDVRVRFVIYRDITFNSEHKTILSDWYNGEHIEEAISYISQINATGGGDLAEQALDGMGFIVKDDFEWRDSVSKFSVLLTDAPYKEANTHGETFGSIGEKLGKQGIVSSAIIPDGYKTTYNDWIVNGGQTGDIASGDYSFLIDWVENMILPTVENMFHNVDIEVNKDNVHWEGHGKSFLLQNVEKGFYVGNLNAVENGTYKVYEVVGSDSYEYAGTTFEVNGEDTSCTVNYYTMTFHDNDMAYGDDTPWHKQIIASGLSGTRPENPEKNGYEFIQWTAEKGGHTGFDFSAPIRGTVNLYADWLSKGVDINARKDNVLWEDSGRRYCLRPYADSGAGAASAISENDEFSDYITDLSSVPNGRYRVYELWTTQVPDSADMVSHVDTGVDFTVTDDDRTIYVDYYTVTFRDGDTVYGEGTSWHSQTVIKNQCAYQPPKPDKECYVFNEWTTENEGGTKFEFSRGITGTTNIYAGWRANRVTVNVRKDDALWENHGKLFALKKDTEDAYITLLTEVENGEYRVYEVYDNGVASELEYRDTGETVTVNNGDASTAVDYYTVTFYNGDLPYGDDEPQCRQIILKNYTASVPLNPTKTGYTFVDWMTERQGEIPFDFTRRIDSPVSLYADWTPNMVIVMVRKDGELWDNHGKQFCISNDGGETYITDLSAVASGIYSVYEMAPEYDTEDFRYIDTGVNVTVTGGRVSGLVDYYTVTFFDKTNAYDDATAQGRQIVIKNGNAVRPVLNPTKKGYRFKNWVTEDRGKVAFDFTTKISEPVNVYASWAARSTSSSSPAPVPEVKRSEPEPRTGDNYHVEIYASVAMIAGFGYLLLYFAENAGAMSEYQKDKLLSSITAWARNGSRVRRYAAIAAIFCVLCYYHSIGKRVAMEWETFA